MADTSETRLLQIGVMNSYVYCYVEIFVDFLLFKTKWYRGLEIIVSSFDSWVWYAFVFFSL